MVVAGQHVAPVKLDFLTGNLGEGEHPDNARGEKAETNRPNPIVFHQAQLPPHKTERCPVLKIVGDVLALFNVDHFGHRGKRIIAFEKKGERSSHADDAQRCIVRV